MTDLFQRLSGVEVIVSPHLAKPVYRQARPHRKRRLRKKWLRKYGMKFDHMEDVGMFRMGNKVFVSPMAYAKIRAAIPERMDRP